MNPVVFDQVYYVESHEHVPVNPVAICPEIFDAYVQWQDTSKGKVVRLGSVDTSKPDCILITSDDNKHYTLKRLTLEIYNSKVKAKVMKPCEFSSDNDVQSFYLNTDFEIY